MAYDQALADAESDLAFQRERAEQAEKERDYWKAMHDDQVHRKRVLRDRHTLLWQEYNRLSKCIENHEDAKGWTDEADEHLHAAGRKSLSRLVAAGASQDA